MKNFYHLLLFLLLPYLVTGQHLYNSWEVLFDYTIPQIQPNLCSSDQNHAIYTGVGNKINITGIDGEQRQSFSLPLDFWGNYALLEETDLFDQTNLMVVHQSYANNLLKFGIYDLEGNTLSSTFQINGSFDADHIVRAFRSDDIITIFTPTDYYKVQLNNDLSWELITHEEAVFSNLQNALQVDEGFIITQGSTVSLINNDIQTIWTTELDQSISSIQTDDSGYSWISTQGDNSAHVVYELNNEGEVATQWNNSDTHYAHIFPAQDGLFFAIEVNSFDTETDNIIFSKIALLDNNGNEVTAFEQEEENLFHIQRIHNGTITLICQNKLLNINPTSETLTITHFNQLEINNVYVTETGQGPIGENNDEPKIGYGQDNVATYYSLSPIYTGFKEDNTLIGSANLYLWDDGDKWRIPGFILNGAIIKHTKSVWAIDRKEIQNVQATLASGEEPTTYSYSLLTYPAKGNPHFLIDGVPLNIDRDLAPFIDVNNDGIYNMFDGDYPDFEGDQMLWFTTVDNNSVEMQGMWYAYDCGDHTISNTVFSKHTFINFTGETIKDFQFALAVDPQLGCHTDDFFGSIPDLNSFFAHNEDEIDGTNNSICEGGYATFGEEPPIQSTTLLDRELTSLMMYQNAGIGGPPAGATDPYLLQEWRLYQNSRFRDGVPLTYGDDGRNPNNPPTSFMYPGNPSESDEWSIAQTNPPFGDRRIVAATTAADLAQGEAVSFDFSYITHPSIPLPNPDITPVKTTIQEVTDIFESGHVFPDVNLGPDLVINTGDAIELDAGNDGVSYLWSTGETTQMIGATIGDYSVTVTDETGCQRTDMIHIGNVTATNEVESSIQGMKISPNPSDTNSPISLDVVVNTSGDYEVSISNLLGQNIYQQTHFLRANNTIILPSIPTSGVYFVTVTDQKGNNKTSKFLIQ